MGLNTNFLKRLFFESSFLKFLHPLSIFSRLCPDGNDHCIISVFFSYSMNEDTYKVQ